MTAATAARRPWRFHAAALLFGLIFGVALVVLPSTPAAAHDALVSSTPASGETVTVSPSSIVLTFSAEILDDTPSAIIVEVTDPSGAVVSEQDAGVSGATVTQALAPGLPDGDYTVTWRVVSSDGHPISSDLHFYVANVGTTAAAPLPDTSSPSAPGTDADGTDTSSNEPIADDTLTPDPPVGGQAALLPLLLVTAVVLLGGVIIVVALRIRQTRRPRDDASDIRHTEDDTSIEGPS